MNIGTFKYMFLVLALIVKSVLDYRIERAEYSNKSSHSQTSTKTQSSTPALTLLHWLLAFTSVFSLKFICILGTFDSCNSLI